MTKFPCSAYISPRERLQLTCCVVIHLASCPGAKGVCKVLCALMSNARLLQGAKRPLGQR